MIETRLARGLLAAGLFVACAVVAPASAQEVRVALADITNGTHATAGSNGPTAPGSPAPALTLSEAVEAAVLRSPRVRRSSEALRRALGGEQEARGAFDYQVRSAPALRVVRQALPPSLWSALLIGPPPLTGPDLRQRDGQAELGLGLTRPMRAGTTLRLDLSLTSRQFAYSGAPPALVSSFFDTAAQFRSTLSAALDIPLQKGRGASVRAPERAAREIVAATMDEVRHRVSEAALETTLAYLRLAAAQQRVQLLEASARRHQDLLALTERQVQAGDLARLEIDRARARTAGVESRLSASRSDLARARVDLVRAMGSQAGDFPTSAPPVARDQLAPAPEPTAEIDALLSRAVVARRDLRRAAEIQAAAAFLESGARADLRRRVDLSVSGGVADLYDGARAVSGLGYRSGRGFYRAFTGRWQPFLAASITVDAPFANRAALGRLARARAERLGNAIDAADLERGIRQNVLQARVDLSEAAAALAHWEAAVKSAGEMLTATLERFTIGDATLFDTLRTEEELTADELQLVGQRLAYSSALARLRFETGDLVRALGDDGSSEVVVFQPAGLVAGGR